MHVKHNNGIGIEHGDKAEKWNLVTGADGTLSFSHLDKGKKMSITKEGKVGIGTDKPVHHLHVVGDAYVTGKMHVDNNYLQRKAAALSVPSAAAPALERLTSEEALIQLDEHVSAKMEDESYGMVHRPGHKKENEPVDYASMMAVMHKVVQEQQATIAKLEQRVAVLESNSK